MFLVTFTGYNINFANDYILTIVIHITGDLNGNDRRNDGRYRKR